MPKPLSTFKASFLHFESTSEPTESAAKDMLNKLKFSRPTQVFVVIYTSGFFVKSHVNRVSNDDEKSKTNQFVSAGLLKNLFKLPFQDEIVLFIFHETVELKTEALLFLFPCESADICDSFVEYLKTLILMRHCIRDVVDAIFVDPDKGISTSSLRSSSNFNFNSFSESNEEFDNSASDVTEPNEIIEKETRIHLNYSGHKHGISNNVEDYLDSKQNTCSTNEIIDRSRGLHSITSSIESLTIDDSDFPSDSEEAAVQKKEKYFNHPSYFNGRDSEQCLSMSASQSLPFISMCSSHSEYTDVFENPISKRESVLESNGRRKSNISTSSKILNQLLGDNEESEEMSHDVENLFSWPEFVIKDIEITSSTVVEMTSQIVGAAGNFSLQDKCQRNSSLLDSRRLSEQYEWEERVNRIHYDAHRKNFKADEEGSILLYCCRQIPIDRET